MIDLFFTETHKEWLKNLCRLCGGVIQTDRQYSKYSKSSTIQSAFGFDVKEDSSEI